MQMNRKIKFLALGGMIAMSVPSEAQLLKGVVKGIEAGDAIVTYYPDGYVINNQVFDLKVDSITGAFTLDFPMETAAADVDIVFNENAFFGAHLEKRKTAELYVTKTDKGVDVKFKGNEPKLNQWVNLWKQAFDSMKYWSPDPSEAKSNAEYRQLLEKEYANLKKNSGLIKGHKDYDYYMRRAEGDYKWTKIRIILDRYEDENSNPKEDAEYMEILGNIDVNDMVNYQSNLSLSAINAKVKAEPGETFEPMCREQMEIVNREVTLDNLRKVMIKMIGQNYFTFGKGHTDEQDKAFIADFMAFAGKDSLLAKPMVEQYYELKKSEAKTASGKAAPDITLQTRDGKDVQLSSLLKGKFTYIDVWATWCGPCCAQIPHLEKLVEKFKDNPKVQFISISTDRNRAAWEKKLDNDKPQWQQYILTPENDAQFAADWGITGIPRFIMIDAEGNIYDANASRPSDPETEDTIKKNIQ